ncbi:Protein required for ethanol metabolism [Rhizoctonia solani]
MPIKSKPALVATRVGLDQFAFAPVAVGLFFSCTGLMEGKSVEQVKQKLNSTINMFIPLNHRLLAVNAVSIPWNAFLSWKGASVSKTVVA